jgi:hypothetical protein
LPALKRAEDALSLGEATGALHDQVAAVRAAFAEDDRDCRLLGACLPKRNERASEILSAICEEAGESAHQAAGFSA